MNALPVLPLSRFPKMNSAIPALTSYSSNGKIAISKNRQISSMRHTWLNTTMIPTPITAPTRRNNPCNF